MSDYKDFVRALASIEDTTAREALDKVVSILEDVPEESKEHLLDAAKTISDNVSSRVQECSSLQESNGTKKSVKELIGEIFPSLSFYPALGIWGMVDKIIQSDKGFSVLSQEESKLLAVYTALFFGLVGSKIAYNRLKERLVNTEETDRQIQEVMEAAGISNSLDDACTFVSNELQNKFGKTLPESEDEKSYLEELINMASMKYNVPAESIKDKLGIIEEPEIEEVPGKEIEDIK